MSIDYHADSAKQIVFVHYREVKEVVDNKQNKVQNIDREDT